MFYNNVVQVDVLQTKYLAPSNIHNSTSDRKTAVGLLRSLRDRCNLHLYSSCWLSNMRYYILYEQCDVAASTATIFIWYARSTADALINYKNTVVIPFLMYL